MAAGGETVLDAMLEAALGGSSGSERPRRIMPGQKRTAHSASPRPQRWTPVDAVRLAKSELAQMDGKANTTSRLRFDHLEAQPSVDSEHPGLHDGFYDFAAAVVRPQPTARQYALQLRATMDAGLKEAKAQGDGVQGRGGLRSGMVLAAERSKREVEVCVETLETFVVDNTIDSKERKALLDRARGASSEAMKRILSLMRSCVKDMEDSDQSKAGMEASMHQLDEDNTGLRHVIQRMLVTEGELRQQVVDLKSEIVSLKSTIEQKVEVIRDVTSQLEKTAEELQDLRDEQARGRPTTDQCVSPMMGFSAFMMSTDQVPNGAAEVGDGLPSWVKHESLMSLSGAGVEKTSAVTPRRKTVTDSKLAANKNSPQAHRLSIRSGDVGAPRLSMVMDLPNALTEPVGSKSGSHRGSGTSSARPSRSANVSPVEWEQAGAPRGTLAAVVNIDNTAAVTSGEPGKPPSRAPSPTAEVIHSNDDHMVDEYSESFRIPEPSLLATTFPSLLPFVDFHMLDPELEKSEADAVALNSEHLEKHLVMLQDDYEKEKHQTEELQHSVDTCLERILVWVQAVHDSLQDLNSNAIQQDVRALTTLRNAVEWFAKHPCKEWSSQAGNLEEVLDEHEAELRGHLSTERPSDAEMEELKKSIAQHRQRVQELSDQLLEARASMGGPVRVQRKAAPQSGARRVSALRDVAEIGTVQHVGVQCDMSPSDGSAFLTELDNSDAPSRRSSSSRRISDGRKGTRRISGRKASKGSDYSLEEPGDASEGTVAVASAPPEIPAEQAGYPQTQHSLHDAPSQPDAADEAGGPAAAENWPALARGTAAVEITARETKRMLLLRSAFVEAIDFTAVPAGSRVLLSDPQKANSNAEKPEENLLGVKQLRSFIMDVYTNKKADDARRDKISQPRRPLHEILQEYMRRMHGVKKVVHQKSWQLIESLLHHTTSDKMVDIFAEFLDESRDIDELSFYLYCTSICATALVEETKTLTPTRFPEGRIGFSRAVGFIELLFGDLPKALAGMRAELEKAAFMDVANEQSARAMVAEQVNNGAHISMEAFTEAVASAAMCVQIDHLYEILLEGWRMSALLLDRSVPSFSWRRTILAFSQADSCQRGWLDPHEVRQAEVRRLQVESTGHEGLPVADQTSLGALVFRCVHRCSKAPQAATAQVPSSMPTPGAGRPKGAAERKRVAQKMAAEATLQVASAAFQSVEKSLGAYLTWMMHSEELRDLGVYRSVKAQIFSFRQASEKGNAGPGAHHLRSLLLLLIAHQFDVQYQQEDLSAETLDWELRSLLQILRESWKRSASSGDGPEFGSDLELEAIDNSPPA
jgi:hypothetical protein